MAQATSLYMQSTSNHTSADWPLLILQPMRSLAQHLNSLVHCLL